MIPVEQYAADTTRIAALAAELDGLDQAWSALQCEFDRVASLIERKQASDKTVEHELQRLHELEGNLIAVETSAIAAMARLNSAVEQLAET